jgi:hypothetical protein
MFKKMLSCLLMLPIVLLVSCASKVTDPASPNFDRTKFRLEDYAHFEKFRGVMEVMFPVGTSKEEVDHVMVINNKARIYEEYEDKSPHKRLGSGDKLVRYFKDHAGLLECKFIVVSIFDSRDTLKKINGYYGCTGP